MSSDETRPSFPAVIDNSMRVAFAACPQKFFRGYLEGWQPQVPSVHLHAGKAFARGLEVTRREYYENTLPARDALEAGYAALIASYGDFIPPANSNKTLDRMCGALVYYFDTFPLDSDRLVPHMHGGKAAVEFSFALPIPINHPTSGEPLLYSGRFDMLAKDGDVVYVEDDKTASQLGPTWGKQWELNSQFAGYCWGAREFGYPVAGAVVRGISILKGGYGNANITVFFPEWHINRWYKQLLRDVERMITGYATGEWDFNLSTSCSNYGGCQFHNVCTTNDPERWLAAEFERRMYDPLNVED